MNATSGATQQAIELIRERLGDRVSTNPAILEHHGHDESWHQGIPPDAVCFVRSIEEVSHIAATCSRLNIPLIPFGTGTGMEGHVVAVHGGISVDLSAMNEILDVNTEDFDCTVQAGVTRNQLNEHLRSTGLFFSVDPGADASIGGMAATRASGTNTVRYGTMRENVLRMKVVLADGRVITTAGRARKSAAGYDLTHLFVGSEGTLGIIVEVTVKLHGVPAAISAASVCFDGIDNAVQAVIMTMQSNIPMARIELLDGAQMAAINRYSRTDYAEKPTLFVEFHGSESAVSEQAAAFGEICSEHAGSAFAWTANTEERSTMWQARHNAAYAAMAVRPGARVLAYHCNDSDEGVPTQEEIDACANIAANPAIHPRDVEKARLRQAMALDELGRFEEALPVFNRLDESAYTFNFVVRYIRAQVRLATGDVEAARRDAELAMREHIHGGPITQWREERLDEAIRNDPVPASNTEQAMDRRMEHFRRIWDAPVPEHVHIAARQAALAGTGLYRGPIDGVDSAATREAVIACIAVACWYDFSL